MPKIKVGDVLVKDERFRDDYGEIEELAVSIQRYGLIHPITVKRVEKLIYLVAGERRLKAHQLLSLEEIEVKYRNDLNELEAREIEIEENLRRKDFTWQEETRAKFEVDKIKRSLYGSSIKGHGGGWSIRDTADSLGVSIGTVSRDLTLAQALVNCPELANEKTKEAAWRKFQRIRERSVIDALTDKIKIKVDSSCIVHGDSAKQMKQLESDSVDLVLTDPPFGIGLDKKSKTSNGWSGKVYDDESQHVMNTIDLVMRECYRVLRDDRHMYLFFSVQHYQYIYEMLINMGFNVAETPLVWHKTGGSGAGGNKYAYASNYEMCFFCMKGRRPLKKLGQSNVFVEPRVAPQRKIHPTEKPLALLRKMIEQSSEIGELVVDPFAGSGATIIAAFETKRQAWGCELDKEYYQKVVLRVEEYMKESNE